MIAMRIRAEFRERFRFRFRFKVRVMVGFSPDLFYVL